MQTGPSLDKSNGPDSFRPPSRREDHHVPHDRLKGCGFLATVLEPALYRKLRPSVRGEREHLLLHYTVARELEHLGLADLAVVEPRSERRAQGPQSPAFGSRADPGHLEHQSAARR